MRVFLVRPDSRLRATTIPLGLGYVAEAVRRAGHEVAFLDARLLRLSPGDAASRILSFAPDLVGITGIHYELAGVKALAGALREAGCRGPRLLGGPLVSTAGDEFVRQGLVAGAVAGEGEHAVVSYLDFLEQGTSVESVPGLIYAEDGEVKRNAPHLLASIEDLVPAWDLLDPEQYFQAGGRHTLNVLSRSRRSLSVFSSRGCPFGCIYCHNVFGRRFRSRSAEAVVAEAEQLKKDYGIEELEFVDDVFNLDLDRAKRIAELMVERELKLHLSFSNGLRADRMDEELLDLLKRAGTYRVNYAVESASPRLQQLIDKKLDLDKTARVIEWTASRGIFTFGYFMMGFPTETEAEVRLTIDYALRSRFHGAAFFYLNPFPNTEIARRFPPPRGWESAHEDMDYTALKVNMSEVPDETLKRLAREAYRRFHFHPARMWRTFKVVPKNWNTVRSVAVVAVLSLTDLRNF